MPQMPQMPGQPLVFTATDTEPDLGPGSLVAVWHGDYRRQQVFVASGTNIGNWYPLGGESGRIKTVDDPRSYAEQVCSREPWRQPPGTVPTHPVWRDLTALGPVTVLFADGRDSYRQGWADGRRHLLGQIETLSEDEPPRPAPRPPDRPVTVGSVLGKFDDIPGNVIMVEDDENDVWRRAEGDQRHLRRDGGVPGRAHVYEWFMVGYTVGDKVRLFEQPHGFCYTADLLIHGRPLRVLEIRDPHTDIPRRDGPGDAAAVSREVAEMLDSPVRARNRRAWANITRPVGADPLTADELAAAENTPVTSTPTPATTQEGPDQ